jgi:hypothetical protein
MLEPPVPAPFTADESGPAEPRPRARGGWPSLRGCLAGMALLILWHVVSCALLRAQERGPVRLGVVMEPARTRLARAWRDTTREQAWCVTDYSVFRYPDDYVADSVVRVYRIERAVVTHADDHSITYTCPIGQPTVHTHPPADGVVTCDPTRPDVAALANGQRPFGVVVCGPRHFRFYYREGA